MDSMAYKQQRFITHSPGGWDSQIKVPTDSVSADGQLPVT